MNLWFLGDQASTNVPLFDYLFIFGSLYFYHFCLFIIVLKFIMLNTLPLKNCTSFFKCYFASSASDFNPFLAARVSCSKMVNRIMLLPYLNLFLPLHLGQGPNSLPRPLMLCRFWLLCTSIYLLFHTPSLLQLHWSIFSF